MNPSHLVILFSAMLFLAGLLPVKAEPAPAAASAQRVMQPSGVPVDDSFFPVAVWLQDPRNAPRFKAAGINLYVGLWNGPTEDQLGALKKAGMAVICDQNTVALTHKDDAIIAGWMHGDEPDNAQSLPGGKGYGPPILPEVIVKDFERIRKADMTRPVLLNLGQGVACDNYIGRGVRRNHPEDYPLYLKGCHIGSFDIYPVVHESPEVTGKLEFVTRGVERLVKWQDPKKLVWNCIECTDMHGVGRKASPAQIRAEVWMSLIRGSRGLIYFVHQFKPDFKEAALLNDPETLGAVTAINQQIKELAPVLNSTKETGKLTISPASPVTALLRHHGSWYVFAANLSPQPAETTFTVETATAKKATVLGESREVTVADGKFTDHFDGYGVHLYQLP